MKYYQITIKGNDTFEHSVCLEFDSFRAALQEAELLLHAMEKVSIEQLRITEISETNSEAR